MIHDGKEGQHARSIGKLPTRRVFFQNRRETDLRQRSRHIFISSSRGNWASQVTRVTHPKSSHRNNRVNQKLNYKARQSLLARQRL